MTYLLDSNVCVNWLRKKGNAMVKARLAATPAGEMCICSIVLGELLFGAESSLQPGQNRAAVMAFVGQFASQPYGERDAATYAGIRVHLASIGQPIGHYDLQIAAIALTHQWTLVTHNTAEFSRVPGLTIVDWEIP